MNRIYSIDFVRGLVMLIMALDHLRDLVHVTALTQDPTDLAVTTSGLFFTRWITHLCAPIFVFLSGVSAFLSVKSKNNLTASRRFLLSRGLWLILLEFTVITFGIWFDIHFRVFLFQVIATIGFGFIILGLALRIPAKILGIAGLVIIFTHNLFPLIPFEQTSVIKTVLSPLFTAGAYSLSSEVTLIMGYPPVPWLGIMLTGFGAGDLFQLPAARRKKLFLLIGSLSILVFILLRWSNLYGDPQPWKEQKDLLFTFLSFINVSKYPPSLLYSLITLGLMFLLLSLAERKETWFMRVVALYGKVPLFYYLIHWYLIHSIMFLLLAAQGFKASDFVFGFNFGRPNAENGVGLWTTYLIWLGVIALLYPVCRWYAGYKLAHKEKIWLRYL